MGYFRRYKLTDYTAEQCRKAINKLESSLLDDATPLAFLQKKLDEWACLRELLARHENNNKSELDKPV